MKKEQVGLQEEIATMKIMIYSLKQAIDDILKAYGSRQKDLVDTTKWEKECRIEAKKLLKENKNEIYTM